MNGVTSNGFESWLALPPERLAGAGLEWLDVQRRAAREQVRAQGVPTAKEEDWRYTSLKGLLEQGFAQVEESITALQPDDLEEILIPGLDSHRIVLVNGRYVPELSVLEDLPKGVRIGGLRALLDSDPDALRDRLNLIAGEHQPLFLALNTAGLDDGFVALFDRAAMLERPIELIHLSVGMDEPRVAQPRHLVVLGTAPRRP